MKQSFALFFGILTLSLTQANASGPATHVCETQINNYVINVLHTTVTNICLYGYGGGNEGLDHSTRAYVRVANCGGYYMFNLPNISPEECTQQGFYGTVPNFINQVSAYGGCPAAGN